MNYNPILHILYNIELFAREIGRVITEIEIEDDFSLQDKDKLINMSSPIIPVSLSVLFALIGQTLALLFAIKGMYQYLFPNWSLSFNISIGILSFIGVFGGMALGFFLGLIISKKRRNKEISKQHQYFSDCLEELFCLKDFLKDKFALYVGEDNIPEYENNIVSLCVIACGYDRTELDLSKIATTAQDVSQRIIKNEDAALNRYIQEKRDIIKTYDEWIKSDKASKFVPVKGDVILGEIIYGVPTKIKDINSESKRVIIEGELFKLDRSTLSEESKLVRMCVTDKVNSICVNTFVRNKEWNEIEKYLPEGSNVIIQGCVQWDRNENTATIMAENIQKTEKQERQDNYPEKRVELHCHTRMSAMDALSDASKVVGTAEKWGHKAIAITDHGVVHAFPEASKAADTIKIIYGCEGYMFDDTGLVSEDGTVDIEESKKRPDMHIILLAKNRTGLKNLYKLVSLSHLSYYFKRPRIPRSVLSEYREGLILSSACTAGELYRAIIDGKSDEELIEIARFYDYLEIQPLINNRFSTNNDSTSSEEDLREINRKIVSVGEKLGKPVCATCNVHYMDKEEAYCRQILKAVLSGSDVEGNEELNLRTTEEMMEEFAYLGEETAHKVVIENTNLVADMIEPMLPVPEGKFPPKIEGAEEYLRSTCEERAKNMYGDPLPDEVRKRLDKELISIIDNGFAVIYRSAEMLAEKSLEEGYLVGSLGSVGSSFAATMAGITDVNPLPAHYLCPNCKNIEWDETGKYDCGVDMPDKVCPVCGTPYDKEGFTIPFETFLGFEVNKEPDIDLYFAKEFQGKAQELVEEIFGAENVFKAGTINTLQRNTAYGIVAKYFEEKGEKRTADDRYRLAKCCEGVKRTTGQHPGGVIIVPRGHEIYEFCPVQHPENGSRSDIITTHFDFHSIDQSLLKLDILGHDIPSILKHLQDMTGVDPLTAPIKDEKVMTIFNGTEGLDIKDPDYKFTHGSCGIHDFGTLFIRQMLDDIKPTTIEELVRISGLSYGTSVWNENVHDLVVNGTATVREAFAARDDIMNYLRKKGLANRDAFNIMERVRKGQGLTEDQERLMKVNDVPDWYIDSCKKVKFMFPRAHAVTSVLMAMREAYYKVYHPVEFYAAYFTTHIDSFDEKVILKGQRSVEARLHEINQLGNMASRKEEANARVLELAYEMYARGYEFAPAKQGLSAIIKFGTNGGKVLLPLCIELA